MMERLEGQILAKHNIRRGAAGATAEENAAAAKSAAKPSGDGKPEVAPDGKPVVRIPPAAPKNGAVDDAKRAGATKPAN
jgi:hypothetical protein